MEATVRRSRSLLLFLGLLLLLVGSVTGIAFAMAIRYEWGEDAVRAWRVAHTSVLTGGMMIALVGLMLDHLVLGARALRVLDRSSVVATVTLLVLIPLGAATGERGLEPFRSAFGTALSFGFAVMGAATFAILVVALLGAYAAWRTGERE